MTGLLYILAFYAAGELLSRLTGGFVSGGVIGMVLLFAALTCGAVKPEQVRDVARKLLANMSIFFIPLGVGIIASYDLLAANLWSIVVAASVSTLLVIAVVGIVQQKMGRRL
ncbi:MAG: CidA/LrgA family protein [Alistipes sp.]|nr:CidA/LrgA family protein [Alistipes sp.]MDE7129606.1 CidA/LrgA family protein [Alistipes sp.]